MTTHPINQDTDMLTGLCTVCGGIVLPELDNGTVFPGWCRCRRKRTFTGEIIQQTIITGPTGAYDPPISCMSAPLERVERRCRNCRRYEWDGRPGGYGVCKHWAVQGAHLVVAVCYKHIQTVRYFEPDPGFYCNIWKGKA